MQSLSKYYSIFHRARTNNPKICMEAQKTLNSHNGIEKAKQSWRHHSSRPQAMIQSCSHQGSTVLAQKQTHRSMAQNRKPRNGPTTIWATNLWQNRKDYPMEKGQSLQQIALGKLDGDMQKNETGPLSYTIHKNKLKMDERPKCKTEIH